jgi:hypothetical protein
MGSPDTQRVQLAFAENWRSFHSFGKRSTVNSRTLSNFLLRIISKQFFFLANIILVYIIRNIILAIMTKYLDEIRNEIAIRIKEQKEEKAAQAASEANLLTSATTIALPGTPGS